MGCWTRYCAIGITDFKNGETTYISSELEEEISHKLSDELNLGVQFADFDDVCTEAGAIGIPYSIFMKALIRVSKLYPTCYFDYEGRGEDWDDWYVCRVHNGRYGEKYAVLPSVNSITELDYDEGDL